MFEKICMDQQIFAPQEVTDESKTMHNKVQKVGKIYKNTQWYAKTFEICKN